MPCLGLFEALTNLLKEASRLAEEKKISIREAVYLLTSTTVPTED